MHARSASLRFIRRFTRLPLTRLVLVVRSDAIARREGRRSFYLLRSRCQYLPCGTAINGDFLPMEANRTGHIVHLSVTWQMHTTGRTAKPAVRLALPGKCKTHECHFSRYRSTSLRMALD